jgi:hypothetical protein
VKRLPVEGWPWPEIVAEARVAASPAEVMAVYAYVANHAAWAPNIVASRVVQRVAPNVMRVAYEYEVPGPNERYTVDLTVMRSGAGFRATWTLVNARFARRLAGRVELGPDGDGARLTYASRVDPGALGVAFGTPASVGADLVETVRRLAARAERLRSAEPERLAGLVARLGAMTAGSRSSKL